jgi:hypothetical protein
MRASILCRRRSLVVIISDFLAAGWETELPKLSLTHDCVCIRPALPAERDFPVSGLTVIEDIESGVRLNISASAGFKAAWTEFFEKRIVRWHEVCLRSGAAALTLSPGEEVEVQLSQFFGKRRRQ